MIADSSLNGNALAFLGDAVYTLKVREFFLDQNYRQGHELQRLCNQYNSAQGQSRAYERLLAEDFFREDEIAVFKKGRNHITHVPKSASLNTYMNATGLETICGYLYLHDQERLNDLFGKIFEGGLTNE